MALNAHTCRVILFLLVVLQPLLLTVNATECSKTNLCKIGCCSKHGFCGTTPEHCGNGCQSTCDFKLPTTECSKTRLCATGCCSKHGFCGTTPEHCGNGCQSTCDYKLPTTECSKTKLCATGCCSEHGFCGTTPEHCGSGCQSTCDFKLGCDKNNPCKDGSCCSKFGFCGFGPDYCSVENCVSGCDAKTFCDPGGYGPEFATHTKCPLNVCCSKWGYCGMTSEFCGNSKVNRPSCSATDEPMRRVVGYYEGWATGRACDQFRPSDIPDGVYTHINFAFASIDPSTFKIIPAAKGDPELYRQLVQKKQIDANLKVFIAIGGWAFNDPGPTVTTFSDIARSETNQRIFISSLISFMNTYGFDGVDIDWEYPVAPDRQGRGEDFKNLPNFLKNIKGALKQNGLRNGLSIAIPASYWYLQHFDIVKIAAHVDHFNVMTYDFHGSWDTPESWLGNHLNSHTNLTEIEDALDLLWRNQIDPDQVNLGLAFYSRTFTVSDPGCMSPGCLFDSGGPKASCTDAVGVMSNAEVKRFLSAKSHSIELNEAAAVKIAKNGREWLTFDDVDTWKLKLDFARRHCLGGAMVWAISQDTSDGRFSKELQSVTGYKSRAVTKIKTKTTLPGGIFKEVYVSEASTDISKDQCRWTNCAEVCPSGWNAVQRSDPYRNEVRELMLDDRGCNGDGVRTFCCPPGDQPFCQWLFFNGGRCKPGCPHNNMFEVGSTTAGCNNGLAQVACCSGETPALDIYRRCKWYGKEHYCAIDPETEVCSWSDTLTTQVVSSWDGSGAQVCRNSKRRGPRDYCCDTSDKMKAHWNECAWYDSYDLGLSLDRQCNGMCPAGKIKVALQNIQSIQSISRKSFSCKRGTVAFCCNAVVTDSAKDMERKLKDALNSWVSSPTCPNTSKDLSARSVAARFEEAVANECINRPQRSATSVRIASRETVGNYSTSNHGEPQVTASAKDMEVDNLKEAIESWVSSPTCHNNGNELSPQAAAVKRNQPQPSAVIVRSALQDIVGNFPTSKLTHSTRQAWDDAIATKWEHLIATSLSNMFSPLKDIVSSTELVADTILCNMNEWDEVLKDEMHKDERSPGNLQCPLHSLGVVDPGLLENVDDTETDDKSTTVGTNFDQIGEKIWPGLSRRAGGVRGFQVNCPNDKFTIYSERYINGQQGDALEKANNDDKRYYIDNQGGSCFTSGIADDGDRDDDEWVSEHILELQAFRDFIEYTVTGKLTFKAASRYGVTLPAVPNTALEMATCSMWKNEFRDGFKTWREAGYKVTPMKFLYTQLGSMEDSSDMVNCEKKLNSMKARVWGLMDPVAVAKWDANCGRTTKASAENAIKVFELLWGVWQYHNHPTVRTKLLNVHIAVADFLQTFEELFRKETGAPPMDLEGSHWREYMVKHFERILESSRGWADKRLRKLTEDWTEHLNNLLKSGANGANVGNEVSIARQALAAFQRFTLSLPTTFTFDTDLFLHN